MNFVVKSIYTKEVFLSWRLISPYAEFWFYFTTGENTSEAENV